jgi:ABC-type multidrug transport system ATPase subunit/ABC-type multidrug transport system permease subunit
MEVSFEDVSFHVYPSALEALGESAARALLACGGTAVAHSGESAPAHRAVLSGLTGTLPAGSMTLILGPPGHGKTALMRALAGQLQPQTHATCTGRTGRVEYGGRTAADLRAAGVRLDRCISFVEQGDVHMGALTVRETLAFVAGNVEEGRERVASVAKALGLGECLDTTVGSATIRGISGGQSRRLSLAEALLPTTVRLLFLDEATTGLDSAVAAAALAYVRGEWRAKTRATVVAALLQPTPDMLSLFDAVICLQAGKIVYHGPQEGMAAYLAQAAGVERQAGTEEAEFAVQVLGTVPLPPWSEAGKGEGSTAALHWRVDGEGDGSTTRPGGGRTMWTPSAEDMRTYGSAYPTSLRHSVGAVLVRQVKLVVRDGWAIAGHLVQATLMGLLLGSLFYDPPITLFNLRISVVLFAAFLLAFANMPEVAAASAAKAVVLRHAAGRISPPGAYPLAAAIVHLPLAIAEVAILGSCVYTMVGFSTDTGRFPFFLLCLLLTDVALAAYFRFLAAALPNAAVAEALAAPSTGVFILFSGFLVTRLHIPDWLVWIYYISPISWMLRSTTQNEFLSPEYAEVPGGLAPDQTYGLIFLRVFEMQTDGVWIWAGVGYIAGFILVIIGLTAWCVERASGLGSRARAMRGQGPVAFAHAPSVLADSVAITPESSGSSPQNVAGGTGLEEAASPPTAIGWLPDIGPRAPAGVLPEGIEGIALTFSDLRYSIPVIVPPAATIDVAGMSLLGWVQRMLAPLAAVLPSFVAAAVLPTAPRVLLDGLTAYAQPGSLTAVMGASGAGKSTLFDVLMGLKTVGSATGRVWLGEAQVLGGSGPWPRGVSLFHNAARVSVGYVQQADVHEGTATVLEALHFSAALRLPAGTSEEEREVLVRSVIEQLELGGLEHTRVGDSSATSSGTTAIASSPIARLQAIVRRLLCCGVRAASRPAGGASTMLSPGQRKRLTIGVELVALPRLLLCDEPTSGLDAREAVVVMRALRRLADGPARMTVLATIHQPSFEVFSMADSLLLLATGGRQVYFGPVGGQGSGLLEAALHAAGMTLPELPKGKNLASWALEVLESVYVGSGLSGSDALQAAYRASAMAAEAEERVKAREGGAGSSGGAAPQGVWGSPPGLPTQLRLVVARAWRAALRQEGYTLPRLGTQLLVALLFGALFFKLKRDTAGGLETQLAVWWMSLVFTGLLLFSTALPHALESRPLRHREATACRMYPPWVAGAASLLTEAPFVVLASTYVSGIVYGMVGGRPGSSAFGVYWIAMTLLAIAFNALGHWFAAAFSTVSQAQVAGYSVQALLFLFGGLFVPYPSVPPGWLWVMQLNPVYYAAQAVWCAQFYCNQDVLYELGKGQMCPSFVQDPLPFPVEEWRFVRDFLGLKYEERWSSLGNLAALGGVYTLLALLTLQLLSHVQR